MFQRDERLTGDPYKAKVSKTKRLYYSIFILHKHIETVWTDPNFREFTVILLFQGLEAIPDE